MTGFFIKGKKGCFKTALFLIQTKIYKTEIVPRLKSTVIV